jgi:hypothetical protein
VDFVEEPEIDRDRFGKLAVRSGHERNAATSGLFLLEQFKDFLTIGKTSRVEVDPCGELLFEPGAPRKQPERDQQQRDGAGLEEDQDTLPQDVASDQSAVEIDAQNRRQHLCGFGSRDRPHGMIVA